MTQKLVVLAQPRTGSTLICSLLSSIPNSRVLVEPINPAGHKHHMQPKAGSRCLVPNNIAQNNIEFVLDKLFDPNELPESWSISHKTAEACAGFKIMAHQIHALNSKFEFWEYLRQHDVKIITVSRDNILQQYVSDLIAQETRQPACWDGKIRTAKIRIPIKTLKSELLRIREEKRFLNRQVSTFDHKKLVYEKFKNNIADVESILPWLLGKNFKLTTKLCKQNPDDLQRKIINYEEIVAEINKIGFNHLIKG